MGLCLVSGKNSGFAVVDFSQWFGFVVWVAFPRVWIYTEHESMGCSKINKINKEKTQQIYHKTCHYNNRKIKKMKNI
jgi:hypothetical protein